MNEKQLRENAIQRLSNSGTKVMSFTDIQSSKELSKLGANRGGAFRFIKGEVFTFDPIETAQFYTTSFIGRDDKEYFILHMLCKSSIRGWIGVPLGKFCFKPFLIEEQNKLYNGGNVLGQLLAGDITDFQRAILLCEAHIVEVFDEMPLHQDYWKTDKTTGQRTHVEDSNDLDYRKPLHCFLFKKLSA